jgi:hypothetical protein
MQKPDILSHQIQDKLLNTTRETEFRTLGHFFSFLLSHNNLFTMEEARSLADYSEKFISHIVTSDSQNYAITLKDLLRSSEGVRNHCLEANLVLKKFNTQEKAKILARLSQIAATLPLIP